MTGLSILTVLIVLAPLIAIFAYLIYKGVGSINLDFLTKTPKPVGESGGGMANAIAGTGVILAIASLLGVPLGIGAGVFLSEYGRNSYNRLRCQPVLHSFFALQDKADKKDAFPDRRRTSP